MDPRLALDTRAAGVMTLLCLVWGMQQVALKAVAADIAPVLQIALRSGIAAVLVGALLAWRRERLARDTWRPGLLVGVLFAAEYLFVGEALSLTSAGHTVVLLYTAPIFAALGLHWKLPAERLSRLQWLGIALAFTGVGVTFLGNDDPAAAGWSSSLRGDLLALLGETPEPRFVAGTSLVLLGILVVSTHAWIGGALAMMRGAGRPAPR